MIDEVKNKCLFDVYFETKIRGGKKYCLEVKFYTSRLNDEIYPLKTRL
jgi:hypothetical protein